MHLTATNQEGSQLIKEWKNANKLFFKINLSAHASNAEIHRLIDALNPKTIVSIHGNGLDISWNNYSWDDLDNCSEREYVDDDDYDDFDN